MEISIYSIRDLTAGVFNQPFLVQNDAIAIRSLQSAMSNPSLPFSMYPNEFALYKLGKFNDDTGCFIQEKHPTHIISCGVLKERIASVLGREQQKTEKVGATLNDPEAIQPTNPNQHAVERGGLK